MNGIPPKAENCKWIDPREDVHGVLLSDMIKFYVQVAGLIEHFDEGSLKPASYGMRLGQLYYREGLFAELKEGEELTIPSNSIVYVSMLEKINMPYYMIGRFNLKIDLIYQGIILGTGPQVDPGFTGHLSCPLHNISNNHVSIKQGTRFATIDFVKTTRFASSMDHEKLKALTERSLYEERTIDGFYGEPCLLFPEDKKKRQDLRNYIPAGIKVSSSVKYIEDKVAGIEKFSENEISKAARAVERATSWERGLAIAALVLLLTTFGLVLAYLYGENEYTKELRSTIVDLKVSEVEFKILSERLNKAEGQLNEMRATSAKSEQPRTNAGGKGTPLEKKNEDARTR